MAARAGHVQRGDGTSIPAHGRTGGGTGQEGRDAVVLLRAAGTLTAEAVAGPDLESLWAAYLAAQAEAHQAHLNWKLTKGSYDEAFYWYRRYYAADQAEIAAYHAWLSARDAALGITRAPFIPGIA